MSRADQPWRFTLQRVVVAAVLSLGGAALLVWQVQKAGIAGIHAGLTQVGWGFLAILAVSLVRFALRSIAWITLMGERVPLGSAVAATIAGDAIGNLTPLNLLVSEPAKALYLRGQTSGARAFAALTAENFFYSVSVAAFIMLGTITMLARFVVSPQLRHLGIASIALMVGVLVAALWIGWQRPALLSAILRRVPLRSAAALLDRARAFETSAYGFARQTGGRISLVIACEAGFHVLSFAESYYLVWLLTGQSAPLAAFVFDTFNRIVNVVGRPVPLRMGVDESMTVIVAAALGIAAPVGVTIALVRKGRMLVWAAVGIALGIRKGLTVRNVMDTPEG